MSDPTFGPYRLVAQVGEGGMGKVYLGVRADQQFEQKVAIKFATGALQDQELALRFSLERQTLAKLDHPNIVRLLDGGSTEEGIPYLIMDHVEGVRLDEYADQHHLSIRQRIALIRKVCAAVQYAHQHLVVHRDIKPANVLVTPDGEPKLLDFGIAKLLDTSSGKSSVTAKGVVPMTLRYGSPEQIGGQPVTVATDLFALGVVLYELLSGHSPHYQEDLAVDEVILRIQNAQPAQPSAVSHLRELAGDLDAIVLKALRKKPADRYSSVADFSEDLRRYLEGRPVFARPASWTYRSSKFVGRHTMAVVSSALFAMALLVAILGMLWQWRVARIERDRAAARFEDVHQLARSFLFEFESAIEKVPGSAEPRILLLKKTSEYLERLSRDVAGDEGVLLDIGEAYLKLGALQASSFESSIGDVKAAEGSYRKAAAMETLLLDRKPNDRQALDITARARLELSDILSSMGRIGEAVYQARKAAEIFSGIVSRDSNDTRALRDAGVAYLHLAGVAGGPSQLNAGDRKGAIEYTRTAIAQYDRLNPASDGAKATARLTRIMLAYLLSAEGAMRQARELMPDVEAALQNLRALHPPPDVIAEYGEAAARVYQRLGDQIAARAYLVEVAGTYREAARADPRDSNAQFAYAAALYHLGLSQSALGQIAEARANFETSAEILDTLVKRDSNNLLWLSGLTDVLIEAGQGERALTLARQLAERSETTPDEVIRYARLLGKENPAAAAPVARRASEMTKRSRWDIEDDSAMAFAAAGNWKDAADAEARALALLEAYKPDVSTTPYSQVSQLFEQYRAKIQN